MSSNLRTNQYPIDDYYSNGWQKTNFSLDLIESAINHLDFLQEIDSLNLNNYLIQKAVYRYETYWLPFYLKHSLSTDLYPPIDVAFIWHCHMLSPTYYSKDCLELNGKLINYELLTKKERYLRQSNTQTKWETELQVSFGYSNENSLNQQDFINFKSKFKYDLIEAAKRQSTFYYQVSLPHFRCGKYLSLALDRYKKFLYLKKMNPSSYIVPCYAIDLIW